MGANISTLSQTQSGRIAGVVGFTYVPLYPLSLPIPQRDRDGAALPCPSVNIHYLTRSKDPDQS